MKNNDELLREVKHEIRKMIETHAGKGEADYADLRQEIRDSVGEYLFQKTQRRPMILPVIIKVVQTGGKEETIRLPVEIWQRGGSWTFKYPSTNKIEKIILDPENVLPDVVRGNNEWNDGK